MRIAAGTSSVAEAAPIISPTIGSRLDEFLARAKEIDWTPWIIVGLGAFLRFFLLGIKPPHFDEGINGWFVDQMVKNGFYRYDPTNYHGPLHFYILFVCQTLLGRNLWAIRLPVVLASIFSVHLTLKFEPFVGRNVSRLAALAMAVSPGFVFYGRYSIHEVWLLLFSMLFILGLLGLWQRGTVNYLWSAGMGLAGMILTKETYIIHLVCAVLAALVAYISRLLAPTEESQGGVSRTIFRSGPIPVLEAFLLPLGVHLLASVCLITAAFVSPERRGYWLFFATIGLVTAFLVPMRLLYGKGDQRQAVSVISFRWLVAFLFSILGQAMLFLPAPWKFFVWVIGPLGAILALRFIRSDRVLIVSYRIIDLAIAIGVGLAAIIFFYSGAFMNWPGVTGLWKCFEAWFKTGSQGAGHEKPFYYWLQLITRYEQPILIALILSPLTLAIKNLSLRYLTIYGVGTLVAYSLVSYKTPWCIISIVWPLLFTFAALAVSIPEHVRRGAYTFVAIVLAISLGISIRLNYFRCSTFNEFNWKFDRRPLENVELFFAWEPYVYVQTYNDVWILTKPLLRLAKDNPTYYQLIGHLIRDSTYPLPWMLGDFTKVGYYEHNNMPDKLDGDFLLVQEDKVEEVESKLHETYYRETMTIRPYQSWSKVYFNEKVFYKIFPGRTPEFTGKPAK
jgi:predicted membrane-bound mannosyltransferase